MDRMLRAREVAEVLSVSCSTVYNMMARRELPFVVLCPGERSTYGVLEAELRKWIEARKVLGGALDAVALDRHSGGRRRDRR